MVSQKQSILHPGHWRRLWGGDEPSEATAGPGRQGGRWMRWLRKAVDTACWLYLGTLLVLWLVLWMEGDRWWLATVLLFGARWPWALPMVPLVPAVLLVRPRRWWVLLLAAVVLLGPVMGFCVPWRQLLGGSGEGPHLRVLTCNTHWGELNARALGELIGTVDADVVALQECDPRRRAAVFRTDGWHILQDGELCLGSRYPIRKVKDLVESDPASGGHAVCYALDVRGRLIYFIDVHLASPHHSFNAVVRDMQTAGDQVEMNSDARRAQSQIVSGMATGLAGPVLLAGDFNTPPDSNIYRQYWAGFENAFSTAGWGLGYTYYYGRRTQIRIDHILGTPGWHCQQCWVGPSVGSMHRPVIADMAP